MNPLLMTTNEIDRWGEGPTAEEFHAAAAILQFAEYFGPEEVEASKRCYFDTVARKKQSNARPYPSLDDLD